MTPHEELYRMQRKLYKRNQEIINHSILVKEPDFELYEKRYKRKVAKYDSIVSQQEMIRAIMKADIVYIGDYHTCNQSQRSFLRILKAIIQKTSDFAIGLELIHQKYQSVLDKYLKGRLKDDTFLKKIGFHQHWVFDLWDNFQPIFDFARFHKIPMVALDAAKHSASLKKRDQAAGERIAEFVVNHPGKKLFVFIGDLHLAPGHLPAEVDEALQRFGAK